MQEKHLVFSGVAAMKTLYNSFIPEIFSLNYIRNKQK